MVLSIASPAIAQTTAAAAKPYDPLATADDGPNAGWYGMFGLLGLLGLLGRAPGGPGRKRP
jgi:hypothetical protein